jgi:hypothetical protein
VEFDNFNTGDWVAFLEEGEGLSMEAANWIGATGYTDYNEVNGMFLDGSFNNAVNGVQINSSGAAQLTSSSGAMVDWSGTKNTSAALSFGGSNAYFSGIISGNGSGLTNLPVSAITGTSGNYIWNTSTPQSAIFNVSSGTATALYATNETISGTITNPGAFSSAYMYENERFGSGAGSSLTNSGSGNNAFFGYNAGHQTSSGQYNTAEGANALYANSTASNNTAMGYYALYTNTASNNTAVGYYASYNNSMATDTVAVGYSALYNNSSSYNTAVGYNAQYANGGSGYNTAVGYDALYTNTGGYSTAVGYNAAYHTYGSENTAMGYDALYTNSSGTDNTAVGYQALYFNTASNNTAVGWDALYENGSATGNTAVGYYASYMNSMGSDNTALGYQALYNGSGSYNTAVGYGAQYANGGSGYNTAMGYQALYTNTGGYNTAVGYDALYTNASGTDNTAVGYNALNADTGGYNTAVGYGSGGANMGGTYNTFIGYNANASGSSYANATAIGAYAYAGASNSLVLGSISGVNGATNNTNVGIGTSSPGAALDVLGTVRFESLTGGTLTTDGSGNVTASSDERLKDVVGDFTPGLSSILNLHPKRYHWNKKSGLDTKNEYAGFIAQDVQKTIPQAVFENKNGMLSLQDRPIVAALVNAIKEQQAEIEKLKKELEDLKTKISH